MGMLLSRYYETQENQSVEVPTEVVSDLEKLTLKELREIAKNKGVEKMYKMDRDSLLSVLKG